MAINNMGNRPTALFRGQISTLDIAPHFTVLDADSRPLGDIDLPQLKPDQAIAHLFNWLKKTQPPFASCLPGTA